MTENGITGNGLVTAKTAGTTQYLIVANLPDNFFVTAAGVEITATCSGTATFIVYGIGDRSNSTYYLNGASYSLLQTAGRGDNEFKPTLTGQGSSVNGGNGVTLQLRSTGSNIDQIAAGCAFRLDVLWGVYPLH